MGLPDVPPETRVYAGPGEPEAEALLNLFARGTIDRMLEKLGPLEVWPFEPDPNGRFSAVVDVFGDGSVWALQGSRAFARQHRLADLLDRGSDPAGRRCQPRAGAARSRGAAAQIHAGRQRRQRKRRAQ